MEGVIGIVLAVVDGMHSWTDTFIGVFRSWLAGGVLLGLDSSFSELLCTLIPHNGEIELA